MIAADTVVENLHLIVRIHHDAGSRRDTGNGSARGCEICSIVVVDVVIKNSRAISPLRNAGHIKDENAARVRHGGVVIHIGTHGVFYLNASHIKLCPVAANDDLFRLPNVNARVRGGDGHIVFDQHVGGLDRIDPVGAVFHIRAIGPFGAYPANYDVAALVDLQRVTHGIFNGEVFDGEITGRNR